MGKPLSVAREAGANHLRFHKVHVISFEIRRSQPRPRPIRVGEEQRPFHHSCAASGKIVSLTANYSCRTGRPAQRACCNAASPLRSGEPEVLTDVWKGVERGRFLGKGSVLKILSDLAVRPQVTPLRHELLEQTHRRPEVVRAPIRHQLHEAGGWRQACSRVRKPPSPASSVAIACQKCIEFRNSFAQLPGIIR